MDRDICTLVTTRYLSGHTTSERYSSMGRS